jgi:gliding motility-associated-like protein
MLKFLRQTKQLFVLVAICLPFLLAGQAEKVAIKGDGQKIESAKNNFTTFTTPEKNILSWEKHNKSFENHPEFGMLPYNAAFNGYVEVMKKRQIDERYFVKEENPSEFRTQKARGALHYRVNDQWITIDPRIKNKGNGIYEAEQQHDPVGFNSNIKKSFVRTPLGEVDFNNWKLYGKNKDGKQQLLSDANWTSYTAGDDGLYITNIFPGIDARMSVERGSVKTDFIVKKLNFGDYTSLLFKDEFSTAIPSILKFKGDAENTNRAVSEVVLVSGTTELVEMDEAVAYPKGGTREESITVEYLLEGNKLVMDVPVDWIKKYIDHTDVIIDPLVTSSNTLAQASITGSMYNASCGWTNSCNYNLSVNTPPNSTLTNALFSFNYRATGICLLSDGAFQIQSGACVTAGYWSCNTAGTGTCSSTNYSTWSDVAACMPAPSCAAQAVPFTLKFYRICFGAAGCSNNCISANSPWTMTLEGHTVESVTPGAEFSVSANTICFGQTISATSSGIQYGVPAYTHNWSFSPTGIPSVGSGSSASISFPAPGTYTLYYTATDGCAQTVTANTVVTVNPLPTLTVTAAPNPICLGQSSVLTASGASTYTWSANAGGGTGPTKTVTPGVGTTNYSVNATSAAGCINSGTVAVTVNPLPTVTAVASPTIVCSGSPSSLTASGASTYTWSANAGGVTTNPVTVSPAASATYTVTGTDVNSCTATATVAVAVTPSPTLTSSATTPTICVGRTDTLMVSGATSYTWMPGGAITSTLSVTPALTTSYTVVGDNGGACTATQTVVITVNALPSLTVTAGPTTICSGASSTLTATGAATYTWSANAGGVVSSTANVSPASSDTYTVIATLNGCKDSANVSVTVVPQPTVGIASTQTVICSGNLDTLTASGATTYTWMPGAANTTTVSVGPGVTTTYTLYGANGACKDSAKFTLNVNATPTITIVATPAAICSGQTSTLTANGISTVTWTPGGVVSNTISVSPGVTSPYVAMGDSLGCTSSQTVTVIVTPQPTVAIASTQTTICSGSLDTLTASGATSYTWMPGAANTTTVSVNPTTTTTYTLVGGNGACLDSTMFTLNVNPTPTVTIAASSASICSNDSSLLVASGATNYTWLPSGTVNDSVYVAPNVTTMYQVTGESSGCTTIQTVTISVTPQPTVTIASTQTLICSGNLDTLTANGAATYTWMPGAANTNTVSVNPNTTTTYTLVGANGICKDSTTYTLNVNPTPTVVVNNPAGICSGSTTTLTATGATTFTWMPGAVPNDSDFVSPIITTTYVVTGDSLGCTSSQSVVVTVTTTPTVMILTPTPTVCSGQSAGMIAGGSAVTYTWSANAGGGFTPSVIVTPSVTTTYSVIGADGICTATATQTIGVTITPTITAAPTPTAICSGSSATITATYLPAGCGILWTPTGATTDNIVVSPTTTTPYTVTATNGGCSASANPTLVVNPTPTLTISSPPFQKVCNPDPVNTISITSLPAGSVATWTNTNTATGVAANGTGTIAGYTSPTVTTSQTGVITIGAVDPSSGCASALQMYTLTINPQPILAGTAVIGTAYCGLPTGSVVSPAASGGIGALTYQWFSGGSPISGATTDSIKNVAAGSYQLVVTDAATGCPAFSPNYTVPGTPAVTATVVASTYHATAPVSVTFTGTVIGATGYSWTFGDGGTGGAVNPISHTYSQGGTYQVVLTATATGCSAVATCTIIVDQPITVTVPNIFSPNGDGINDEFEIVTSGVTELTCEIFNRWGQKVYTLGSATAKWDGKLNNGHTATEGTYFYMLIAKSYDGKEHKQEGTITVVR